MYMNPLSNYDVSELLPLMQSVEGFFTGGIMGGIFNFIKSKEI